MAGKFIELRQNILFRRVGNGVLKGECELIFLSVKPKYGMETVDEKSFKAVKYFEMCEQRIAVDNDGLTEMISTLVQIQEALDATDELAEGINEVIDDCDKNNKEEHSSEKPSAP